MSSDSTDDLENERLVRLEDIQPSNDSLSEEEVLETCIIDDAIYEECIVDDDDSNIGSMVSIQSEEVVECDEDTELIGPDLLPTEEIEIELTEAIPKPDTERNLKPNHPDRWPTLEILPGGVINLADKTDNTNADQETIAEPCDMMYACAKCSQSFKYLFCLVKHVRWHEDEEKKIKNQAPLVRLKTSEESPSTKKQKNVNDGFVKLSEAKQELVGLQKKSLELDIIHETKMHELEAENLILQKIYQEEMHKKELLLMDLKNKKESDY